jgi:uncharacterized membrane protein (UPF0127 family)
VKGCRTLPLPIAEGQLLWKERNQTMRAVNLTTGEEIAGNVTAARSILSRMKGLLGKKEMAEGEGMLIEPCKGIHTFGMRFGIDVIFFDRNRRVVAVWRKLRPNRLTPFYFRATGVIELPAGALDRISAKVGDEVAFV